MSRRSREPASRLALSVAEAAAAVGVSERHLRSVLHEIPHCRLGGRVVIPVQAFADWLGKQARAERAHADAAVDEILESLSHDE